MENSNKQIANFQLKLSFNCSIMAHSTKVLYENETNHFMIHSRSEDEKAKEKIYILKVL